jgi:hypothetical protein
MTGRSIDEIQVAADPGAWRAAGFDMAGDVCEVGSVRLRLLGEGPSRGIVSWSVRGPGSPELDGLDTTASQREPASGAGHPNGVVAIDHVVILSPELDRTVAVLRAAGFDFRRLREGPTPGGSTRQAFFRLGEVIVEVVQAPAGTKVASDPHGPARLWESPSSWITSTTRRRCSAISSQSRAARCSRGAASRRSAARHGSGRPSPS